MIHYDKETKTKDEIDQRLSIGVNLNKYSEFVDFDVVLNQIPVAVTYGEKSEKDYKAETKEQRGKDVTINWDFLDSFDTDDNLWIDANGLFMHQKRLWQRQDFKFTPTTNIAGNFYPV